jgi:hypothetical protein
VKGTRVQQVGSIGAAGGRAGGWTQVGSDGNIRIVITIPATHLLGTYGLPGNCLSQIGRCLCCFGASRLVDVKAGSAIEHLAIFLADA